jgi:hypothetical protein
LNPIYHVVVLALAIAAYVVLTVTGHDGNPVFVFIGGQAVGAAVQAKSVTNTPPSNGAVVQAPSRTTIGN